MTDFDRGALKVPEARQRGRIRPFGTGNRSAFHGGSLQRAQLRFTCLGLTLDAPEVEHAQDRRSRLIWRTQPRSGTLISLAVTLGGVAPETSGRSEGGVDVSGACRALPSEALGPETEA